MKSFILVFILLLNVGCAGMRELTEQEKDINRVFEVPSMTKSQIYQGTKIWIAQNFKSSKAVIEYDNAEEGTLIGNGNVAYPLSAWEVVPNNITIDFTMRVDVKDAKFKISFFNIRFVKKVQYTSDYPLHTKSQLDEVSPILIALGDGILKSLGSDTKKKDF